MSGVCSEHLQPQDSAACSVLWEEICGQDLQATAGKKSVSAVIFLFQTRKQNNQLYIAHLKESTKSVQVNTTLLGALQCCVLHLPRIPLKRKTQKIEK